MISASGLRFDYPGTRALDGVGFEIAERSVTALVGPNGSGKTTLLRCLAGLEEPYSGSIRIDGIDVVRHPREAHQRIGFLPDHFGLYKDLTGRQCLRYAGAARGLEGAALERRAGEVASQLGIADRLEVRAGTLSRGQRQRLAMAQALIHQPKVLLLDEPASGLDPEARAGLASLMRSLQSQGMTLVVSSHILAELEEYSSAMLVLRSGRVIEHRVLHEGQAAPSRRIRLRFAVAPDATVLERLLPGATRDEALNEVRLDSAASDAELSVLLKSLVDGGLSVCGFQAEAVSLQDAYLSSVKRP